MTDGIEKSKYFSRSARAWLDKKRWACPNCESKRWTLVKRKYVVTALVRCDNCDILYRAPTDPPSFGETFYQREYQSGFTTDCPTPDGLQRLKSSAFRGTAKDFSQRTLLLKALHITPGSRILDYGASWGYGTWQLLQAGYQVVGYEISRRRARYAREMMELDVVDDMKEIRGRFDVFFSCHVLEHVPCVHAVLELARNFLRSGGLFVALTPNGSRDRMTSQRVEYHRNWGAVHPNYLDERFYQKCFRSLPRLIATTPFDLGEIRRWNRVSDAVHNLSGDELLVAAVFNNRS